MTARSCPSSAPSLTRMQISRMTPATGDLTAFSVFMTSMFITSSPFLTRSPALRRRSLVPMRQTVPLTGAPISPLAADKRLEVNLAEQMVYAYENNVQVLSSRCATGTEFSIEGQGLMDFRTTPGSYTVVRKRPSRHMRGSDAERDTSAWFDLPGVPFCTYFTGDGAAVHGAYWHNDFGHPRSHGCVNVPPEVAKWVWRWSQPVAPYDDTVLDVDTGGTPIIIL